MKFKEALKVMQEGTKVKLPSWGGYWYWDADKQTIMIHTKDGKELPSKAFRKSSGVFCISALYQSFRWGSHAINV